MRRRHALARDALQRSSSSRLTRSRRRLPAGRRRDALPVQRDAGKKKSRHRHRPSGSNGPAKHEGTRKATHYTNVRLLRAVGSRQVPVPFRHSCSKARPRTKKACSRGTRAGKKTDQHSRHEGCPWKITARGARTLAGTGNFATSCRRDTAIPSRVEDPWMKTGDPVTISCRSPLWLSANRAVPPALLVAKHHSVQSAMYGKLRLRIGAARTLHCREIMYVLIYIAAVAVANLMVAHFGPAATPIIAFFLIGLDLAIRDRLHLDWRGRALWSRMLALIAAAGVVSYALNPAAKEIALASLVAFGSAAVASAIVFQLARRFPMLARANGANVAGAAVDSIVFPLIAFGAVFPTIAALQFVAKVAGGALWSWVVFRNTRTGQAGIARNVVDR